MLSESDYTDGRRRHWGDIEAAGDALLGGARETWERLEEKERDCFRASTSDDGDPQRDERWREGGEEEGGRWLRYSYSSRLGMRCVFERDLLRR